MSSYESAHGYFIYRAMKALDELCLASAVGEPLYDGAHLEVVDSIVQHAGYCIKYFDEKYLHPDDGWNDGVYDYDVWDDSSEACFKFYRMIALLACDRLDNITYQELVDAYAKEQGWKPGMGGTGE